MCGTVLASCLAESLGGAFDVENIIGDLKQEPDTVAQLLEQIVGSVVDVPQDANSRSANAIESLFIGKPVTKSETV